MSRKKKELPPAKEHVVTMQHDEFTNKPILDASGNEIPRDFYLLEGINCDPFCFNAKCQAINAKYSKNRSRSEIKAHPGHGKRPPARR